MTRALLFACIVSALPLCAADVESTVISLSQYKQDLEQIRAALKNGDTTLASGKANRLLKSKIRSGDELLEPDRRILSPITTPSNGSQNEIALSRLSVLIESLSSENSAESKPTSKANDQALLETLRQKQALSEPQAGGDVLQPHDDLGLFDKLGKLLSQFLSWLGSQIKAFFTWLGNMFTTGKESAPSEYVGPFTVMALLCVLGLCSLLIWDIIKKNRAAKTVQPVKSALKNESRDADPLSRNANEWEVYARQLGASGQYRESIRAWYHAVLVTLYRTGTLHYRKGRTNWEYCYSLSPSLQWRPEFMELTRRFEFEWYGKHSSNADDLEACARQAQSILSSVDAGARR